MCQFQTEVDKNYRKLCQLVLAILTNCKSVKQCFQSSDLSRRQGDGEQKDQLFPGAETDTGMSDLYILVDRKHLKVVGENIKQRIIPLDNTDLKDLKMNYIGMGKLPLITRFFDRDDHRRALSGLLSTTRAIHGSVENAGDVQKQRLD